MEKPKPRFLFFFLLAALVVLQPAAFAAHGCTVREPDRDGDGVPDKDDPFPDDPTQGGLAEKFCGPQPVSMQLFFIPFSADPGPVTKGALEGRKANAVWFCSQNEAADSILNILEGGIQESTTEGSVMHEKMGPNDLRMKLVRPQLSGEASVYYADKSGIGTKNGHPFRLDAGQMTAIENKIKSVMADCGEKTKTYCEPARSAG